MKVTESRLGIYWFSIRHFRRIFFAMNLVLLNNYPLFNIPLHIVLNCLTIAIRLIYKPYRFKVYNFTETVNDIS